MHIQILHTCNETDIPNIEIQQHEETVVVVTQNKTQIQNNRQTWIYCWANYVPRKHKIFTVPLLCRECPKVIIFMFKDRHFLHTVLLVLSYSLHYCEMPTDVELHVLTRN
jgi:hypothetical protein